MHLILLETSGNQNYIFATNKLRENVGASQLTYLVGTRYVIEAVHKANGKANGKVPQTFAELKDFLLSDENTKALVEIVVATSGKAIVLVKSDDQNQSAARAREIVGSVTKQALRAAPGLSMYGVIEEFNPPPDGQGDPDVLDQTIKRLHEEYEVVRSRQPGPEHRFLRFPFAQACTTSYFPARCAEYFKADGKVKVVFRSFVAQNKQDESKGGRERMQDATKYALELIDQKETAQTIKLPDNLEKFENAFPSTDWLAVIHADGNGLGQIFLDFRWASSSTGWRDYLNKLREFSLALDECTIRAYGKAVSSLHEHIRKKTKRKRDAGEKVKRDEENRVPVLPLVLGGDDLTLICDGRYAIQFTKDFLGEFERQTKAVELIKRIAKKALGDERLSSCAGVAIVKPHFPFHAAYGLAEDLLQSAKEVKRKLEHRIEYKEGKDKEVAYPASALDYHILYDTSGVDLERIRGHLRVDADERTRLYARPYLVTPKEDLKNFKARDDKKQCEADEWREHRYWTELKKRVKAMRATDEQNSHRRLLPNSMLHDLREGLFMGKEAADSRMKLARPRYQGDKQPDAFDALLCERDPNTEKCSMFCTETITVGEETKQIRVTGFLDALDIVEFWRDER
jgi:hypothetical protein